VGFLLEFGPGQASDSECQCVFSLPFQASGSECQCVFVASVSVCLWLSLLLAASGLFFFFFLCSFPFVQLALSLFSIKKRFVACFYAHNQCDHPEPGLFYYNSCHNSLSFLLMHSTFDFQDILLIVSCRGSLPQCICSCRGSRTGFNLAARGNLQ
jgi:hypothetical protein